MVKQIKNKKPEGPAAELAEASASAAPPVVAATSETETETATDPNARPPAVAAHVASKPAPHVADVDNPPPSNVSSLAKDKAKLVLEVKRLGKDNGSGKKSMVALAERVVEASNDGIIGTDDAEKIYEMFRKESAAAQGLLAAADQEVSSAAVGASKLRKLIEMGKGMHDDAWPVLEMGRDMHIQAMATDDKKLLKVKSTYEALISICREQLKDERKGIKLNEEDLRGVLFNEENDKGDATGLDLAKQALKTLENAERGKKATSTKPARDPLSHENLKEAILHLQVLIGEQDPAYFAKEQEAAAKAQADADKAAEKAAAIKNKVAAFARFS